MNVFVFAPFSKTRGDCSGGSSDLTCINSRNAAGASGCTGVSPSDMYSFPSGARLQPVQGVFQRPRSRVDEHVLVRLVITVEITDDGQVRSIGDPEVSALPGQTLDAVEARGEDLEFVRALVAMASPYPSLAIRTAGPIAARRDRSRPRTPYSTGTPGRNATRQLGGNRQLCSSSSSLNGDDSALVLT